MVGDKMLINFLTLLVSTIAITYLLSIKNMNIGVKIFCTTIYIVLAGNSMWKIIYQYLLP